MVKLSNFQCPISHKSRPCPIVISSNMLAYISVLLESSLMSLHQGHQIHFFVLRSFYTLQGFLPFFFPCRSQSQLILYHSLYSKGFPVFCFCWFRSYSLFDLSLRNFIMLVNFVFQSSYITVPLMQFESSTFKNLWPFLFKLFKSSLCFVIILNIINISILL